MTWWLRKLCIGACIAIVSVPIAREIYLSPSVAAWSREHIPAEFWIWWFDLLGVTTQEGANRAGMLIFFIITLIVFSFIWLVMSRYLRFKCHAK